MAYQTPKVSFPGGWLWLTNFVYLDSSTLEDLDHFPIAQILLLCVGDEMRKMLDELHKEDTPDIQGYYSTLLLWD